MVIMELMFVIVWSFVSPGWYKISPAGKSRARPNLGHHAGVRAPGCGASPATPAPARSTAMCGSRRVGCAAHQRGGDVRANEAPLDLEVAGGDGQRVGVELDPSGNQVDLDEREACVVG